MAGLEDYKLRLAAAGVEQPEWPGAGHSRQWLMAAASAAGLLTEHVLLHPLLAARWQCQVNATARRYHLTPVTLVPVLWRLQRRQGPAALWKGLGSCVVVRGLRLAAEDLVSKVTGWPREVSGGVGWRRLGRHLALRAAALALASPFSAAALAETAQSAVASERCGPLDVLVEGGGRALAGLGPLPAGRLLPGWLLAGPAALLGLLQYVLSSAGAQLVLLVWRAVDRAAQRRRGAVSRAPPELERCWRRMWAAAAGRYAAELALYPLETALHRLQLQGARAIVDDLDSGVAVAAVSGRHAGLADCLRSVAADEGVAGLYRGVGAVMAQACLHAAALCAAQHLLARAALLIGDASPSVAGHTARLQSASPVGQTQTAWSESVSPAGHTAWTESASVAGDIAWPDSLSAAGDAAWPDSLSAAGDAAWPDSADGGSQWRTSREQRYAQYEREFERYCAPERARHRQ